MFEIVPGITCAAPHMRGLGFVMPHGITGGARRIDTCIALLLQLDELRGHAHIVDVAEDILQRL